MKVAIVLYPGSNCSNDIKQYFERRNNECFYIWHKNSTHSNYDFDLLVIPGGFAFGDRYYQKATGNYEHNPGKMAIESAVTNIILETNKRNIPIFGVCNGFQILTKLGLLPGSLKKNANNKFSCLNVSCDITTQLLSNNFDNITNLDVANQFGNYTINEDELETLKKNNQILLRYNDGYKTENGSVYGIGGVFDEKLIVLGMMPHPERTNNSEIYNVIENMVKNSKSNNDEVERLLFEKSIEELMFSEHISYKSTKKYLKNMFTEGAHVIQGPGENAGIVDIGDGYCLAMRIESHNHPIFIDPFNGSATGVGGILRDIFTMGARPIAVLDFLRFGSDQHSHNLLKETVRGISYYGNCFGVANVGGNCVIDDIYKGNPLCNVACIGIMKKEHIVYGNALNENSVLVYVGSKTGCEGVNGAKMASESFSNDTNLEELKSNIQTGDPFLEKLLLEACLEIVENNLFEGMQDMGAGGLLCASLEVVQRGREKTGKNLGCVMNVENIPTKYDMNSCDTLISESHERMLLVVRPENVDKVFSIFEKWDLEYSVVGTVDESGFYTVKDRGIVKYDKDISTFSNITQDWPEKDFIIENNVRSILMNQELWSNYDSTIGNRTIRPVNRVETFDSKVNYSLLDIYENNKQLIISWGENFDDCLNPIRDMNFKPLGIVNCLNYGHPNESMGAFKNFVEQLTEKCVEHSIPILGGNVSLYNSTDDKSINPTPILVMTGIK